ncbi:hypothetical protein O3P69_011671 [Scylla paramamosain]|uniref:Uncharacterized protein n=1 Tax=Scylla paramamosain TaxID=85552 RepID=A0AAW0SEX9_SCYPA
MSYTGFLIPTSPVSFISVPSSIVLGCLALTSLLDLITSSSLCCLLRLTRCCKYLAQRPPYFSQRQLSSVYPSSRTSNILYTLLLWVPMDDFCSVSICGSQGTGNTDKKEIVRTAHSFLKKAFNGLIEPCDWFMLQFLELEKELYGQESAISVLERYKSDPCHAPAHHLAYHFYKNLVPGSVMEQLMELEVLLSSHFS